MHKFDPNNIARLIRKERYDEIRPEEVLREAGLRAGDSFFDVGSGPGFFAIPGARVVGRKGKVYAVDTEELMLSELQKRRPPKNVLLIKSGENRIPAPASTADFMLVAYVLHETADRKKFLREMRRVLKAGAKIFIIDWKIRKEEHGPPFEERLTIKAVKGLLREAGFRSIKSSSLNVSHYAVTAVNNKRKF
ncbi:MAG: class I SAM-dependent methyltransferase [Thermodesulfobacteriota bacterium]